MYTVMALIGGILLISLDQFTKHLAILNLKDSSSIIVIDGVFELTYVANEGAAFGIFQGGRWFFITLTIAILVGIALYYTRLPRDKINNITRFTLILISAGAIGNMIDRIRQGFVVDFFRFTFINFPVFNIADILVVTGTIVLSVLLIFFMKDEENG